MKVLNNPNYAVSEYLVGIPESTVFWGFRGLIESDAPKWKGSKMDSGQTAYLWPLCYESTIEVEERKKNKKNGVVFGWLGTR